MTNQTNNLLAGIDPEITERLVPTAASSSARRR